MIRRSSWRPPVKSDKFFRSFRVCLDAYAPWPVRPPDECLLVTRKEDGTMRNAILAIMVLALSLAWLPERAEAGVRIHISKSSQTMRVYVGGQLRHTWRVSTGRRGYNTPNGNYSPKRLARRHYSSKYHGSPMPYSIFFRGGYAIHGSYQISRLGRRASHGCVRLHPGNAARLFSLVRANRARTRIVITN